MNARKLVLLLVVAIAGALVVFVLFPAGRQPVAVRVVLRTNDSLGFPRALVALTNISGTPYNVRCVAEVFEAGRWTQAFRQNTFFDREQPIAPAGENGLSIPIPAEGEKWRLKLHCQRQPALPTKLLRKLLSKAGFAVHPAPRLVIIDMPPP